MQRLTFANQLRGVAALSVVFSHLVGVFWGMRDFIGLASATPVQLGPPPDIFVLVSYPWLNFGPLGVGIFFLISGLVIPFSLERHNRGSFLAARVLRIFPTYVLALGIELAVLHFGSMYWQRPFPYSNWAIVSNLLLFHSLSGQPSIDLVNWTLGVELKFYLIMMLAAPWVRAGRVAWLFGLAALIVAANLVLRLPALEPLRAAHPDVVRQASIDSLYLIFMLLGVLFNAHVRALLPTWRFVPALAAMLALFLGCWQVSAIPEQYPVVTVNYLYALALFGLGYLLRRHARPLPLLDFFAAISFPLYLVHSLVGYSLLKLMMLSWHLGYDVALPLTLCGVVLLAWLLHRSIELRSIALGHRCAPRPGRPASAPGPLKPSLTNS